MDIASLLRRSHIARYFATSVVSSSIFYGAYCFLIFGIGTQYVFATVLAYVLWYPVNFYLLQRWTFENGDVEKLHRHHAQFVALSVFNFVLTVAGIYGAVEYVHLGKITGQITVSVLVYLWSYFPSRWIFR